jgi:hypothetical protein
LRHARFGKTVDVPAEDELAALVTRDSLIGTDVPHPAREAKRG